MKFRIFMLITLLSLAATLMVSSVVFAQQQPPPGKPTPSDDQVNAVAKGLYCPVCENTPLDVCPTQACAQWRELIRLKLSQGWTDQQIKDYFVVQYGDRVLAQPPLHGFNWVFYVGVVAALVLIVTIFVMVLRRLKQSSAQQPLAAPPPAVDREYLQRLEDELKKR